MNNKKEIGIVGAGLSGLTAGINLAKAGYKVKIFEKNDMVGKRFHGDYQGIENWVYEQDAIDCLRDLNIELNFPCYPVNELNIIGPDGVAKNFKFLKNAFYLVKRGTTPDTLDQNLYQQAIKSGVEIIFNSPQNHLCFGDIIARGYFPDPFTDAIAFGYTFLTDKPDQAWVIVDDKIAPDGYNYCLIANGQATIAICIFKNYDKSQEYLTKTAQIFQQHIGLEMKDARTFGGTSNGFLMKKATFNSRLYVGEAAGFIDGMWGFGMKYAMKSGYLAAQSIIEGADYEKLWKKELYPQLKASLVNRWFYKILGQKSYGLIIKKMEKSPDFLASLKKISTYYWLHKLALPFAWLSLRKKLKDRRFKK
ncbi:MAG: NAD(P)/FAD-dependent oxidoreductase [Patescibacteria group bacterium]